jgi:hypothetical protein
MWKVAAWIAVIGIAVAGVFFIYRPPPGIVGDPEGSISIESAMRSVGASLAEFEKTQRGLVPQEVTITFNINAKASSKGQLEVGAQGEQGTTTKSGATSERADNRDNSITIKLVNPLLVAPGDTVLGTKSADEIARLLQVIRGGGVTLAVEHAAPPPAPGGRPPAPETP